MPVFNKSHVEGDAQPPQSQPPAEIADQPGEGYEIDGSDPQLLVHAIDGAFHYRGDVTIIRKSDPQPVVGYIFDRRSAASFEQSTLRIMLADGDERLSIAYSDIDRLNFSGRDTAAGKSFDTWMKKYVRKKLAGLEASIHSEPLDGGA